MAKTENRIPRHLVNSVAIATILESLTGAPLVSMGGPAEVGGLCLPEATRHPPADPADLQGGTSMSITTARQMARQAEEARRAAREHDYLVSALRREQLVD